VASSPEHLLEICDVVLRLLAASAVHSVILRKRISRDGALINATSLAYLMEQCQSLKTLTLAQLVLDENHCRVLGAYSRPDLDIELESCKLTSAGTIALVEVLVRNQRPTKLDHCDIDNSVLADGLRGFSRLKSFSPDFSGGSEGGNREVLAIARALPENRGLLDLCWRSMSDDTWDAVCDSLKTHPTLEVLNLSALTGPTVLTSQIQVLLDMMKMNMTIHTIRLHNSLFSRHELFRQSVIPYLETNRFRPRVHAIQKTRPLMWRAKVLGRALLAVRNDPNPFWMLLSGNAEVAFPSTTATTTAAASLPASAAVAVSANVAPVVATGSATASNGATPTVGQKRKSIWKSRSRDETSSTPRRG
jgi:hypothetical protein